MRRLFALLLLCLLLPSSACAALPPVESLATIAQIDKLFRTDEYIYNGNEFRYGACGPCSVTNAFITVFGVTDKAESRAFTLDMLHLLTEGRKDRLMNFDRVQLLAYEDLDEAYPALSDALRRWGGAISYTMGPLGADVLDGRFIGPLEQPCLMIGAFPETDRWAALCRMAHTLYHGGHQDAAFSFAMLAAGTNETHGAFRSGTAGHYVCLYIPVKDFCESGAVYLIDSLPRALKGEKYSEYRPYIKPYDFSAPGPIPYELQDFLRACTLERVTNTTIRILPARDISEHLLTVVGPAEAAHAYKSYLSTLGFANGGIIFIHVPAE